MKNELTRMEKAIILKSVNEVMTRNYKSSDNVWYIDQLNNIIKKLNLSNTPDIFYGNGYAELYDGFNSRNR